MFNKNQKKSNKTVSGAVAEGAPWGSSPVDSLPARGTIRGWSIVK